MPRHAVLAVLCLAAAACSPTPAPTDADGQHPSTSAPTPSATAPGSGSGTASGPSHPAACSTSREIDAPVRAQRLWPRSPGWSQGAERVVLAGGPCPRPEAAVVPAGARDACAPGPLVGGVSSSTAADPWGALVAHAGATGLVRGTARGGRPVPDGARADLLELGYVLVEGARRLPAPLGDRVARCGRPATVGGLGGRTLAALDTDARPTTAFVTPVPAGVLWLTFDGPGWTAAERDRVTRAVVADLH